MSCVPYASFVGILIFSMVCTRPNISRLVGFLSRYMSKPRKEHWTNIKRVFMYLHGTTNYGIFY
jgi:hypothetical protein